MSKLVGRHCISEANNRANYGTPAFGNPNAPLMPLGREQAARMGGLIVAQYGFDPSATPVAASELRRSQETAEIAGFIDLHIYPALNEEKGELGDLEVRQAITSRKSPEATVSAARYLIEHPPKEEIWITHAYLVATICQELGVYTNARFIPKFGELRELPL